MVTRTKCKQVTKSVQEKFACPTHFPKKNRGKLMAAIRSKNTSPEIAVMKTLRKERLKFLRRPKTVLGSPDFVLKDFKTSVFVHGCFWHVHGRKISRLPQDRKAFWIKKYVRNISRDQRTYMALRRAGWRIIVIWECAIKGKKKTA